MPLILKTLSFKGQPLAQSTTVTVADEGATIGRSHDNTLVLTDPERFVSRHHATISIENGLYYLADSSLSGIFIAGQEQPLHNSSQQIFDGMLLKIGEYEVAVSIVDEINQVATVADFPFAHTDDSPADEYFLPLDELNTNSLLIDDGSAFVSHEELIYSENTFQPAFESKLRDNPSPLFDSYIAPTVAVATSRIDDIPDDFSFEDLLADVPPARTYTAQEPVELADIFSPLETKNAPVAPPLPITQAIEQNVSDQLVFAAFLQGAGIDDFKARPEQLEDTMQRVGGMFRKLVDGTVTLLRSRAEFKSLFRVNMTVIKATDNNPLKFTVTTDDVLRQLLDNKSSGFLDSGSAIEEGFADIMNHQLAMQAGIQAALTDLLRTFDPKLIEKQFEQGLVLQKKSKCWDKFTETYQHSVDEAIDNFFGDAFSQAYQAQMKILTRDKR